MRPVMVFMLSMIFAFALIAMTTVAMTIFAVLLMRWMLEFDRSLCHAHMSAEAFRNDEAQASRAIS
ncbi:MAG: hypothetical protein WCA13_06140 [Terriglobales bacterium]